MYTLFGMPITTIIEGKRPVSAVILNPNKETQPSVQITIVKITIKGNNTAIKEPKKIKSTIPVIIME